MELPAATWVPCNFQMDNWTMEPPVWAPAFPVEYQYAATEIFGNCLQISGPSSSGGHLLVESAQATHNELIEPTEAHDQFEVNLINMEAQIHDNTICEFEETTQEFQVDMDTMKMKIHRYPASLRGFDEYSSVPRMVAMGPYHHGQVLQDQLKKVEKVKYVAAYHCVIESGHSLQEVYDAVVSAAHVARHLYDNDVMAGIGDDDFLPMMFYDACFLVQYMLWCTPSASEMEGSLRSFFDLNRKVLRHDLMLLENQLPWLVVEAVMRFRHVELVDFIADWRYYLQDRKILGEKPIVLDDSYEPPHLLGLLRFYMVGRSNTNVHTRDKFDSISVSVSAIELAEIGIKLTVKETRELIHMGISRKGILSAELSLAPLSLDDERASFLINMAALELCTTSNFQEAGDEDSAVCSYLLLLSMLVHREEDVQELRTKHLLQGGAGLINKEALGFFTSLQSLPLRGLCYGRVMVEIERYKMERRMRIMVHTFLYRNKGTILAAISVIGVLVSILGTLMSLKSKSKI
ncbi:hypothetical protein HU200_014146 [Digitaria exilis]|uniref:Uncharacterized protein n=1 Tax=Digitaria exilis TaxID=1010633 RepID=A0A835A811_9POAL|nr:hypothetical protein HU200_066223 [Digitaria exilis]KAF8737419.1 hypothetical protein HU200_014146 [Digitaria exilis]